jgi:peptide deformylase
VEVEAIDINGRKIRLGMEELISKSPANARYLEGVILSRVIQHEIDHLSGILIIDRISFWQRRKIKRDLKQRDLKPDVE